MSRKKILLCCNSSAALKNFRQNLIKVLIKNDYVVVAVVPDGCDCDYLRALGAKVVLWPVEARSVSLISELSAFLKLFKILYTEESDLNIFYSIKPILYGNLINKALNRRCLNIISGLGYIFIKKNAFNSLLQMLLKFALRKKSNNWCLNKDDMMLLLKKGFFDENRAHILPGEGVDVNYYTTAKCAFKGPLTFLMISRVIKDKGIEEFALAAKKIKEHNPEARFVLIGNHDKSEKNSVETRLLQGWISTNVIDYVGEIKDVRPFIEECTCLVLPSYREGLPRTILEAFSMQKIAVASDVAGCNELVIDGEKGFLCKPASVDSLVDALKKVIALDENDKRQLEENVRNVVVSHYSDEIVCETYLKFLSA